MRSLVLHWVFLLSYLAESSQQPHTMLQGWGRMAGKLPGRKGPWGGWLTAGWTWASSVPRWPRRLTTSWLVSGIVWPAGVGRWLCPCIRYCEATPGVLCSVLGPSLQERHWGAGACPKKVSRAGKGSREQILWGEAEGTGIVRCGEEEAEGRVLLSKATWKEVVVRWWWSLLPSNRQLDERKWLPVASGEV